MEKALKIEAMSEEENNDNEITEKHDQRKRFRWWRDDSWRDRIWYGKTQDQWRIDLIEVVSEEKDETTLNSRWDDKNWVIQNLLWDE